MMKSFNHFSTGQVMQNVLPQLGVFDLFQDLAPHPSKFVHSVFPFRPKLVFQALSQSLRQRRTVASCGDGDLQRSPLHHGRIVEIRPCGVIHHIAEHPAATSFLVYPFVQVRR